MNLFWQKGYAATSMADLVDELGIGKKSLYDTFGSKRDLYVKALRRYSQRGTSFALQKLNEPGNYADRIERLMRSYVEADPGPDSKGCMIGCCMGEFGDRDPEIAGIALRYLDLLERAFLQVLQAAKLKGEISESTDIEDLAQLCIATVQGLSLVRRSETGTERTDAIVQATTASLPNKSPGARPSINRSKMSLSMLIRGSPLRAVTTSAHKIQDSPKRTQISRLSVWKRRCKIRPHRRRLLASNAKQGELNKRLVPNAIVDERRNPQDILRTL